MAYVHRYSCAALLMLTLFFSPAHLRAQMDSLTNIGHASVKIKTAEGTILYIDPYAGTGDDYLDSADVLLVTHSHSDHNLQYLVPMKSTGVVITYGSAVNNGVYSSYTVGSIVIDAVPAYNTFHSVNSCVGYVVEFNGIRLYHTGDTGLINEMSALESRHITYALLPMDGVYTMSPEGAMVAAGRIKAAYNIPIHTMPPPDTYSDAIVARFTLTNKIIVKHGQTIALSPVSVSVEKPVRQPVRLSLQQNFPNPFNPTTTIRYTLDRSAHAELTIFDSMGRRVETIVDEVLPSGEHSSVFNAERLSGGLYYYRLTAGSYSETKKLVLMK